MAARSFETKARPLLFDSDMMVDFFMGKGFGRICQQDSSAVDLPRAVVASSGRACVCGGAHNCSRGAPAHRTPRGLRSSAVEVAVVVRCGRLSDRTPVTRAPVGRPDEEDLQKQKKKAAVKFAMDDDDKGGTTTNPIGAISSVATGHDGDDPSTSRRMSL